MSGDLHQFLASAADEEAIKVARMERAQEVAVQVVAQAKRRRRAWVMSVAAACVVGTAALSAAIVGAALAWGEEADKVAINATLTPSPNPSATETVPSPSTAVPSPTASPSESAQPSPSPTVQLAPTHGIEGPVAFALTDEIRRQIGPGWRLTSTHVDVYSDASQTSTQTVTVAYVRAPDGTLYEAANLGQYPPEVALTSWIPSAAAAHGVLTDPGQGAGNHTVVEVDLDSGMASVVTVDVNGSPTSQAHFVTALSNGQELWFFGPSPAGQMAFVRWDSTSGWDTLATVPTPTNTQVWPYDQDILAYGLSPDGYRYVDPGWEMYNGNGVAKAAVVDLVTWTVTQLSIATAGLGPAGSEVEYCGWVGWLGDSSLLLECTASNPDGGRTTSEFEVAMDGSVVPFTGPGTPSMDRGVYGLDYRELN